MYLSMLWLACTPDPDPGLGPDVAVQQSLEALQDQSRTPVVVHPRFGVPAAVTLQVPTGSGSPFDEALEFLEAYAPLYGLQQPTRDLHPAAIDNRGTSQHVRFVQRTAPGRGGLPLFNSSLTVHMADGVIYLTNGRWVPDLTAAPPRLTPDEALAQATFQPDLTMRTRQGEARLGLYAVWPDDEGAASVHTVWRMVVLGTSDTGAVAWQVDIDARSGDVVHHEPLDQACDRDFDIMFGNHEHSISCYAFVDTQDWFDVDGALSDYSAGTDHGNEGLAAFNIAHDVYDYWENTFGMCSYDADDAEVEVVTHATIDDQTSGQAVASGYCGTMVFAHNSVTTDVFAHEFTHMVDYNHADLEYRAQSGAIDESFADVLAALMTDDWILGEGVLGRPRNLADPPSGGGGDPDHVDDLASTANPNKNNDWGNVHTNSGIMNKAAFLLTDGGLHRGFEVTGIGASRAEQLYKHVLTTGLFSTASFRDARNSLVGTAEHWASTGTHGFSADHACEVARAFSAVGVAPDLTDSDCDGTPDAQESDSDGDGAPNSIDNCPTIYNLYQFDVDGDGLGDACDEDVDDDGLLNADDNCVRWANPDQRDTDGDGRGDACDDSDGDGTVDAADNCVDDANWDQSDVDGDGAGDVCDPDADDDGIANADDNCWLHSNADQADGDGDQVGDVCDNCPSTWNPDQKDCDGNGVGSACDDSVRDRLACIDFEAVDVNVFVHPLDEVSLPHVAPKASRLLPDGYQLELTVTGAADDWAVRDHHGAVVARAQPVPATRGRVGVARWTPATDYHYLEDGERAAFATTYQMSLGPAVADGVTVDVQLEGVQR